MTSTSQLLLIAVTSVGISAHIAAADEFRIDCPAIRQDDRRRTNYPGETAMPIELIAVVRPVAVKQPDDRSDITEVDVGRILYGHTEEQRIRIRWPWRLSDKPQVVALAPDIYEPAGTYQLKYTIDAAEEQAMAALAQARLDVNVLGATAIFIGHEIEKPATFIDDREANALGRDDRRLVHVELPLAGASPVVGARIVAETPSYIRSSGRNPRLRSEPLIYFLGQVEKDPSDPQRPIHHIKAWISATSEKAVKTSLARRDSHPIVESADGDEPRRVREVLYLGTVDEAMQLLGSTSDAAVTLGLRKLLHDEEKSLGPVVAEVETRRFLQTKADAAAANYDVFRRQHNLIRLLGKMKDAAKSELVRLSTEMIDQLAADPPAAAPTSTSARLDYLRRIHREADDESVNHSLVWLLEEIPENELMEMFGKRMLALRDAAEGAWRKEIQLAIDTVRIEDHMELAIALKRVQALRPARATPNFWHTGAYELAFSPDGKYLAAVGGDTARIWNTSDWSLAAKFPQAGSISRIVFANDGESIFIAGGGARKQIHRRIDRRNGAVKQEFVGHRAGVSELQLSADQRVMVTGSFYEGKLHVWDVPTGRILRSHDVQSGGDRVLLHPAGKFFVRYDAVRGKPIAESVSDGAISNEEVRARGLFSPDGSVLYAADNFSAIQAWSGDLVSKPLPSRIENIEVESMTIAHGGNRLTIHSDQGRARFEGDSNPRVTVLSLPELKQVAQCSVQLKQHDDNISSFTLSPDGRVLAVGVDYDPPQLFEADTGRQIPVGATHQGDITHLSFDSDGKTLRSFGEDEFICRWDAETMRLVKRVAAPANHVFVSARRDGLVALFAPDGETKQSAKAVDCQTGAVLCTVPISVEWRYAQVHWLSDREILCCGNSIDDGRWYRCDYYTGKILAEGKIGSFKGGGELSEDAKSLWSVSVMKGMWGHVDRSDLETMTTNELDGFTPKVWGQNQFQLIPGGKQFLFDGQIYDRKSLRWIGGKNFGRDDLLNQAVSPDGSRFAVVTGARIYIDNEFNEWDRQTRSMVRVHELPSCKTIAAFPSDTRWVRSLTFSSDGRRLALVTGDNTIESWPIGY
jgi:WD40 repeat protein